MLFSEEVSSISEMSVDEKGKASNSSFDSVLVQELLQVKVLIPQVKPEIPSNPEIASPQKQDKPIIKTLQQAENFLLSAAITHKAQADKAFLKTLNSKINRLK